MIADGTPDREPRGGLRAALVGAEALALVALLPAALRLLPASAGVWLARRWSGPRSRRPAAGIGLRCVERIEKLPGARRWLSCLPRALLRFRYLRALGHPAVLHLGVAPAAPGSRAAWRGHAWVTVEGRPVAEDGAALMEFREMARFPPKGSDDES